MHTAASRSLHDLRSSTAAHHRTWRLHASVVALTIAALFAAPSARAGMPVVLLEDLARMRVDAISFFLVSILLLSWLVQKLWNYLRRDSGSATERQAALSRDATYLEMAEDAIVLCAPGPGGELAAVVTMPRDTHRRSRVGLHVWGRGGYDRHPADAIAGLLARYASNSNIGQ